jgi:hypothetical protein
MLRLVASGIPSISTQVSKVTSPVAQIAAEVTPVAKNLSVVCSDLAAVGAQLGRKRAFAAVLPQFPQIRAALAHILTNLPAIARAARDCQRESRDDLRATRAALRDRSGVGRPRLRPAPAMKSSKTKCEKVCSSLFLPPVLVRPGLPGFANSRSAARRGRRRTMLTHESTFNSRRTLTKRLDVGCSAVDELFEEAVRTRPACFELKRAGGVRTAGF